MYIGVYAYISSCSKCSCHPSSLFFEVGYSPVIHGGNGKSHHLLLIFALNTSILFGDFPASRVE